VQISLSLLCLLYAAFMVKHFLCDFPLQTAWMAAGKSAVAGWQTPLAAHVATHAAGTALITLATVPSMVWLALLDLVVHASVDRTKSVATRGLSPAQSHFWWAMGLDQGAHQATHFCFVIALVSRS
jgi:hypothetical protein